MSHTTARFLSAAGHVCLPITWRPFTAAVAGVWIRHQLCPCAFRIPVRIGRV